MCDLFWIARLIQKMSCNLLFLLLVFARHARCLRINEAQATFDHSMIPCQSAFGPQTLSVGFLLLVFDKIHDSCEVARATSTNGTILNPASVLCISINFKSLLLIPHFARVNTFAGNPRNQLSTPQLVGRDTSHDDVLR